jgi:hypothetical protein
MSRPTSLLIAAAVATAVVGCAHCDTCDDFPAPCVDCGYSTPGPVGATMYAEGMPAGPMMGPGGPMMGPAGSMMGPGGPMPMDPSMGGYPGMVGTPAAPPAGGVNAAPAPPSVPGSGLNSTPASPASPPAGGTGTDLPPIPPPGGNGSPF